LKEIVRHSIYLQKTLQFDLDESNDIDENIPLNQYFYHNHHRKYHREDQLMVVHDLPRVKHDAR